MVFVVFFLPLSMLAPDLTAFFTLVATFFAAFLVADAADLTLSEQKSFLW